MTDKLNKEQKLLNNKITIQSSILQKIQELQLSSPADQNSVPQKITIQTENSNTLDLTETDFYKKIKQSGFSPENPVNIWTVNSFISIIGETYNARTEYFTKKNNFNHIETFLNDKYKDQYVVITFKRSKMLKGFKKCILFEDINFSLELAFEISQIAKFHLDNQEKTVIIFEMRNGFENIIFFLISCVLSYCKFFDSSESAFESLISRNSLKYDSKGTILRYIRYFDQAQNMTVSKKTPQLILNQAIVTNIPTILSSSNFKPIIIVKSKYDQQTFSNLNCYKDDDFIVISDLNFVVFGDTVISLFFEQSSREHHVLDLKFNTLFYQQGLYRFGLSEIELSLPQESIYRFFDEKFYFDIVLLENKEIVMNSPTLTSKSLIDTIQSITEHFFSEYDLMLSNRLREKGYNKSFATFCAQMHYSEDDSCILYRKLIESGHKTLVAKTVFTPSYSDHESEEKSDLKPIDSCKIENIDFSQLYSNQDDIEAGELDLIEDPIFSENNLSTKKVKSSLLFRRKTPKNCASEEDKDLSSALKIYSKRPIHLMPIKFIERTIFNDMNDINFQIDYQKFESYFCDQEDSTQNSITDKKTFKSALDPKRLFLASLAIKSLELNGITSDNIENILKNNSQSLEYQDILNLLKILPENEKEKDILFNFPLQDLDKTEKTMLNYSSIPEIYDLLEILKFEKIFFEEIKLISKVIDDTNQILNTITSNKNIKILFKPILDIGNTINYKYSKNKKAIQGFKIDGINLLGSYYGNGDRVLLDFLIQTAKNNQFDFVNLEESLKEIHYIKNEDLTAIKSSINDLIVKYRRIIEICDSLVVFPKEMYKKLVSYAYKKLLKISEEYKECVKKAQEVKEFFGEDQSTSLQSILGIISGFLVKISSKISDFKEEN